MKSQVLAERLFKLKWLTAHEADDADLQYDEVVHSECFKHREKFATFNKSLMLLICFLGSFSTKNKNISFWRAVTSSLFFPVVKVSSKESSASINNCLKKWHEKALVFSSQKVKV